MIWKKKHRYLPCWLSQFSFSKLRKPTGQRLSNFRTQVTKISVCQSYSYTMRKFWYHQIWNQNNLGFMVLILTFIPIRSKPFLPRPKVYKNDRIVTHNLSAFDFVECNTISCLYCITERIKALLLIQCTSLVYRCDY